MSIYDYFVNKSQQTAGEDQVFGLISVSTKKEQTSLQTQYSNQQSTNISNTTTDARQYLNEMTYAPTLVLNSPDASVMGATTKKEMNQTAPVITPTASSAQATSQQASAEQKQTSDPATNLMLIAVVAGIAYVAYKVL